MEQAADSTVVATYVFRGVEYVVSMNVVNGRDNLIVEVEDRLTADQWRGSFDAAYIEELTHKTGNFKQFSVFVSMLESGITQNSDSVSLDLLTYSDLESLRNRKAGVGTRNIPPAKAPTLNSKRYLILTYTVEFDRIHYPLPLPYMGKPDPRGLQETIRQLRDELKVSKEQGTKDYRSREFDKLKKDYSRVIMEKDELEDEYLTFKREVGLTSVGTATKEIHMLKVIVKNVQDDLLTERTKYQRQAAKRSAAYRQLQEQVEELTASERNLKARVKSLTNELALYKRNGRPSNTRSRTPSYINSGSSRENSFNSHRSRTSYSSQRSSNSQNGVSRRKNILDRSRERNNSLDRVRDRRTTRSRSSSVERTRSLSRDRYRDLSLERSRDRNLGIGDRSRDRSLGTGDRSRASSAGSQRSRAYSPSCAGARYPRFDPTGFVKERDRKQRDVEVKSKRGAKPRLLVAGKKSRRSPLLERPQGGSVRSRASSIESLSDINVASDSSQGRHRYGHHSSHRSAFKPGFSLHSNKPTNTTRKPMESSNANGILSSPEVSYSSAVPKRAIKTRPLASTPDSQTSKTKSRMMKEKENKAPSRSDDYFDRSAEISEIDERLNRLQQFMKTTLGQ